MTDTNYLYEYFLQNSAGSGDEAGEQDEEEDEEE